MTETIGVKIQVGAGNVLETQKHMVDSTQAMEGTWNQGEGIVISCAYEITTLKNEKYKKVLLKQLNYRLMAGYLY